jgi:hypothetical protein
MYFLESGPVISIRLPDVPLFNKPELARAQGWIRAMIVPLMMALFLMQAPAEQKLATLEGVVTHAATQTPIRKAKVGWTAIGFAGGGTVEPVEDDAG